MLIKSTAMATRTINSDEITWHKLLTAPCTYFMQIPPDVSVHRIWANVLKLPFGVNDKWENNDHVREFRTTWVSPKPHQPDCTRTYINIENNTTNTPPTPPQCRHFTTTSRKSLMTFAADSLHYSGRKWWMPCIWRLPCPLGARPSRGEARAASGGERPCRLSARRWLMHGDRSTDPEYPWSELQLISRARWEPMSRMHWAVRLAPLCRHDIIGTASVDVFSDVTGVSLSVDSFHVNFCHLQSEGNEWGQCNEQVIPWAIKLWIDVQDHSGKTMRSLSPLWYGKTFLQSVVYIK